MSETGISFSFRLQSFVALLQKIEEKQREQSKLFRKKMEDKVAAFLAANPADMRCLTMPPMTKYERSVVHDVSEVTGSVVAHR